MRRLGLMFISFLSFLVLVFGIGTTVKADETTVKNFDVVTVTKDEILANYVSNTGVSFAEAERTLFPNKSTSQARNAQLNEETSYVVLRGATYQDDTLISYIPNNAGHVYFYCEVSKSGWFRGIKRIVYAGYYSGNLIFQGNFQYALPDANRIHFTLNGHLYRNTSTTTSIGAGIGIGQVGSFNVGVADTSSYHSPLYYHGNRSY